MVSLGCLQFHSRFGKLRQNLCLLAFGILDAHTKSCASNFARESLSFQSLDSGAKDPQHGSQSIEVVFALHGHLLDKPLSNRPTAITNATNPINAIHLTKKHYARLVLESVKNPANW